MKASEKEKTELTTKATASLSVAFVCIVVGLPLWWKTTEVYRVHLPYAEIADLSHVQCLHKVEGTVIFLNENVNTEFIESISGQFTNEVRNAETSGITLNYKVKARSAFDEERQALKEAKTVSELDELLEKQRLIREFGKYSIYVLPDSWSKKLTHSGQIGVHRSMFLKASNEIDDLKNITTHILRSLYVDETMVEKSYHRVKNIKNLKSDKESMRAVRYQPGYEVIFSLINQQPDILNVTWQIKDGISVYMKSLQKQFKQFADITIKSQYLYYVALGVQPTKDDSAKMYTLNKENLPHIINPIEAYLNSPVSTNPNLNFIVYVPTRDQSPLHILDDNGSPSKNNALFSPQWGGIHIYNVESPKKDDKLPKSVSLDMQQIMQIFMAQLRLLLGIGSQELNEERIQIAQPGIMGVTDWEVDKWLRKRTLENLASSSSTLQSLVQLLEEVGNIVINDDIGLEVSRAVDSIHNAYAALAKGQLHTAFINARQAVISSEKAFFDPSLLELLYFPEDQKFAIYIPLFLPISIPVILSVVQAIKLFTQKDKKSKEE